jgi:hypothetical protein
MPRQTKIGECLTQVFVIILVVGTIFFSGPSCSCKDIRPSIETGHNEKKTPARADPSSGQRTEIPREAVVVKTHPREKDSSLPPRTGLGQPHPGRGRKPGPSGQDRGNGGENSGGITNLQLRGTNGGLLISPEPASPNQKGPQAVFREALVTYQQARLAAGRGDFAQAYRAELEAWQLLQHIRGTNLEAAKLSGELEASLSEWADRLSSSTSVPKPSDSQPLLTR